MSYHLRAVEYALKSVQMSGKPAEIGEIYIRRLDGGLPTFEGLVKDFELTCKWAKTTGRYVVEKPGRAYK